MIHTKKNNLKKKYKVYRNQWSTWKIPITLLRPRYTRIIKAYLVRKSYRTTTNLQYIFYTVTVTMSPGSRGAVKLIQQGGISEGLAQMLLFALAFGGTVKLPQEQNSVKAFPGQTRCNRIKGTEVYPCTKSSRNQSWIVAKTASTKSGIEQWKDEHQIVKGLVSHTKY